jgi:hypothetical protein
MVKPESQSKKLLKIAPEITPETGPFGTIKTCSNAKK